MVRLEESSDVPLGLEPPTSQRLALAQLTDCPEDVLLPRLRQFKGRRWERCTAVHWHALLNRFDEILAAYVAESQRHRELGDVPCAALVHEVLRALYEVLSQYPELKGVFPSADRLRDLLECMDLAVVLGALRCLSICTSGRSLRGTFGADAERQLEALAGGMKWPGGLRAACAPGPEDGHGHDFLFEVPRGSGDSRGLTVLTVPFADATADAEAAMRQLVKVHSVPEAYHPSLRLQLRMWCHARTTAGRRDVVAISLYALCDAVRQCGPGFLRQHLQKRPGLFAELSELLRSLQVIGHEAGVAALRAAGAILDSRYGHHRVETTQLSQMLGLSVPHGIVACALRALLSEEPPEHQLEGHYEVLLAALDLFQVTTTANHQTTAQLGHAGMILAMLELMQKTDVRSLPAVVAMLRCLELAAEVSSSTALVLFREFRGLPAFSARLKQEVDLLMALDFQGNVYEMEPPREEAGETARDKYWALLEEVTARRRLCRQLLKNIQAALQCSEVIQAGLTNVFQGPLMEVLKKALQEPQKVGLCLFGIAVDIVSNLIQDDPSRVPQMIESDVLPGIVGALSKDTMRSVECLSFVPGVLGSISLHAVGEDFILSAPSKPIKLLVDILVDPSFAALLHSQPELAQIMSTHMDKVIRNRPAGPNKLTAHVVECIIEAMKALLEEAKAYPAWSPSKREDRTEFLADRLAGFARFCWSALGASEHTLAAFLEQGGLSLVRQLHELPCLPYHLCSLESQQHPLSSLFNLQAGGGNGSTASVATLQEMLTGHHAQVRTFLKEHLSGPGDPHKALAARSSEEIAAFLRSLSNVAAALEGLLAVCREGATVQVLEALQEPVGTLAEIVPALLTLASWRPKQKEPKSSQISTYTELAWSVLVERRKKPGKEEDTGGMDTEGAGKAASSTEATEARCPENDEASTLLHVARQCFRLSAHTARQLLVIVSKQLHSRTRQREVTPGVLALARTLATVSKAVLSVQRPSETAAVLRWVDDAFELLLRMHEERNRVAVRPLCLCTFYQSRGFELLGPLLQLAVDNLDKEPGPPALASGLTYFEKVTSYKRFTNAPQVGVLRAEDGLIPRDPLCRSVQSEALKCVLRVWRHGDFSKFPDSTGQSLMKVWVHALDGPRDIPARPAPRPAESATGTTGAGTGPDGGAGAAAGGEGDAVPTGGAADDGPAQAVISPLVNMGFSREQVERGLRQLGHADIGTLIMWMVSNPEPNAGAPQEAAGAAAVAPTPEGSASVASGAEAGVTPGAAGAAGGGATSASAAPPRAPATADEPPRLPAATAEEFQAGVSDMLTDLLPRILTFGRQVPNALPVVADTMAFFVATSVPLWEQEAGAEHRRNGSERNAQMVVKAFLDELGDAGLLPPSEALACVSQILASLLHRRPQVANAFGESGIAEYLTKLHRWSLMSINFCMVPFARGYRLLCLNSAAPVPIGVGEPPLAAPSWLTPVVVWAHQLFNLVDLVKLSESKAPLNPEIQRNWVTGILHIIFAFPGMDSGLALACLQVLTRLCSTPVGAKAFLEYQPRLSLDASGSSLKAPAEGAGGLQMLLRWSKQASFPGMLQMLVELVLLLLEEGPTLQQRMESEILGLFTPQNKAMPAKDITRRLYHLMSRAPELFEDALKAVTQRTHNSTPEQLVLEPIPEAERPQRPKLRSASSSTVPLLVLQTLTMEACFGLEVQHHTSFMKIYDATKKVESDEGAEAAKAKVESSRMPDEDTAEVSKADASKAEASMKLLPPFPLALGPDALLFLLESVLARIPGLGAMLLKPLPPQPQAPQQIRVADSFVVDGSALQPQKSMLLVMTRYMLPRFAGLVELWQSQVEALKPAQKSSLQLVGGLNPVQRCLPHLGACLCSAARHSGEPRRCLIAEVTGALRALAEGPRSGTGPDSCSFGAEVAAVSGMVARLLSVAAAADRKDEKDGTAAEDGRPGASSDSAPLRLGGMAAGASEAAGGPPKRPRGKRELGYFSGPGEAQALRESLVAILGRLDLCRSDSAPVATTVVKCLEFLSRWEANKGAASAPPIADDPMDADDPSRFVESASFQAGEPYGDAEEHEREEEEEDEDDDMGGDADEDLDDAMDVPADDHHQHHHEEDHGGDEDEEDYDDEMEDDDYADEAVSQWREAAADAAQEGVPQHSFATILNNAIHAIDQQGLNPDNMTLRVDIDLGEAGVIHGVSRAGHFQQVRRGGRGNALPGGGWSEQPDLEAPVDHPLLRQEQHQHHNQADQHGRYLQWIPALGNIRQIFGGQDPTGGGRGQPGTGSRGGATGPNSEAFDAAFAELSGRLREGVRVGSAPPPAAEGSAPAVEAEAAEPPPPAAAAGAPATAPAEASGGVAASTAVGGEAPEAPAADQGAATEGEAATEAAVAQATEGAVAPAATSEAQTGAAEQASGGQPEDDAVVALGIPELHRLATRMGCTQAEILQAAEIDPTVVAELPEDMRSAVVMATISQVNLDHLRRSPSPPASAGAGAPARGSQAGAEGGATVEAGRAAFDGLTGGIDAAVLEALPPDIREEVLREEEAMRREQQQAAQRAAVAREAGSGGGAAAAPAPAGGGEMDNASFIASLDPLLREEVLMTAPEELLQTLPAELRAEAQLIQDRAFTRIATRRPAVGEAPPMPPQQMEQSVVVRMAQPGPRQHPHLQVMEQQLLIQAVPQGVGGIASMPQGHIFGEEVLAQLGLQRHLRLAVGGHGQHGGRQVIAFGPAAQATVGAASGLASFEATDRQLLERLSDFDDDCQAELPLPLSAITSVCRLLYLRQEVQVTPMTRLFFNLSLHPQTRSCVLGHFVVLLCCRPQAGSPSDALPPPHLFEGLEHGQAPQVDPTEIQAIGSQRVLSLLAYLLRRIPQCGEFLARRLRREDPWMEVALLAAAPRGQGSSAAVGSLVKAEADPPEEVPIEELEGQHFVNLLLRLLGTKLFLSSSQHATWLLSILHALLVQRIKAKGKPEDSSASITGVDAAAPAGGSSSSSAPVAGPTGEATAGGEAAAAPAAEEAGGAEASGAAGGGAAGAKPAADRQSLERWAKVIAEMHSVLSQQSVLALCHFLCQAGSGHGSSGEGDTFQMASEILVALAASQTHLDMVRSELLRVLASLVTDIETALAKCEVTTAEPSTMETRLLRVVRTLADVFAKAKSQNDQELKIEDFLQEARIEALWAALDRTLERLDDTEVMATPAQRLLSSGLAPSAVRVEGSSGLSAATSATLSSNVQAALPKPLLNRLLPLIEAFFALHDGSSEAEREKEEKLAKERKRSGGSASSSAVPLPASQHVFSEYAEVSFVERSRLGVFCKQHRRPLNALAKQTPSLLSRSFAPLLRHMPACLDFDNKRAYFRSQLRSRRLESRYEPIRLRVRRGEIFMDSYHQLRKRTGEEMRAKIQVQFQGEEGIDAGGVGKEWYSALAKEIFNPNYALFVQAGGKACTYHPNTMSYVNRDHLHFFQFIGRVIGKAIHDGQNLEAWFTRGFYKHMLGRKVIPADLEAFDPEYFSNLKWMLDNDITEIVELFFCAESDELGQQRIIDLKPNGRKLPVTNDNKHEYIQLMSEHKMTNSVRSQIDAFLKGLHEIVPSELLSLFDDKELELLISGLPDIDIEDLKNNTEYHNYTAQSEQVQWFWKVLSDFTQEQRAWFLQFATGTSRVPVEGFKGLVGMRGPQKFSIHKAFGGDRLPSAHTCFNQLDLPDYPSEEVLREKLMQAVSEGHEGFGFA